MANGHLDSQDTIWGPSVKPLKLNIDILEANNDFACFATEHNHRFGADSVNARYLSPETSEFAMAREQIQKLLDILDKDQDLTKDPKRIFELGMILRQSFELAAEGLRGSHHNARQATNKAPGAFRSLKGHPEFHGAWVKRWNTCLTWLAKTYDKSRGRVGKADAEILPDGIVSSVLSVSAQPSEICTNDRIVPTTA